MKLTVTVSIRSPETVESIIRSIDREDRGSRVGFRDPAIPLQYNHFGPNLVVDLRPLVQNFLYVIL
jgi:hypothetical protein